MRKEADFSQLSQSLVQFAFKKPFLCFHAGQKLTKGGVDYEKRLGGKAIAIGLRI